jgi:hypothetical protein
MNPSTRPAYAKPSFEGLRDQGHDHGVAQQDQVLSLSVGPECLHQVTLHHQLDLIVWRTEVSGLMRAR